MSKDDKSEEFKGPGKFTAGVGRSAVEGTLSTGAGAVVGGIIGQLAGNAKKGAEIGAWTGGLVGGTHGFIKGAHNAAAGKAQFEAEVAQNKDWQAQEKLRNTIKGEVGRG